MPQNLYKKIYTIVKQYNRRLVQPLVRKQLLKCFPASSLIRHDILDRPYYAYGLLVAFDEAKRLGYTKITVIELGVGDGRGLVNLCETASALTKEFAIDCEVVGFDTGTGLPAPQGYRDNPEIFSEGEFAYNKDQLTAQLPANATIIYGDVQETVPQFCSSLQKNKPIGFVSLDLDLYSSTKKALNIFLAAAENYLPAVLVYLDDIEGLLTYSSYCGEMLALTEFNQENQYRKIERKPVRVDRKGQYWHRRIYCCHILDHPVRNSTTNILGCGNEIIMSRY